MIDKVCDYKGCPSGNQSMFHYMVKKINTRQKPAIQQDKQNITYVLQNMATFLSATCLYLFSDTSLALTMIKRAPMLRKTAFGNSCAEDTQWD